MFLKIYNSAGSLKLTASPNASSTVSEEVMGEYCVSAAFTHPAFVPLDVNDYAVVDGVRYKVRSRYRPRQKNRQTYEYNVKLYAPIHDAEGTLFLFQADGEVTTEFSYDGDPRAHLQLWVDNMNRIAGQDVWSIGTVIAGDPKTIEYRNVYCWDAAFGSNGIAATFNTEMWADGYVVNLCKAERGDRMELGYLQGLTGLAQEENGEVRFFTRLFPLGSTRNIDASKYGHARLQLPSGAAYVDKNTELYGIKDGYEEAAFAHIYPKYVGSVTSVRSEQLTNEEGRDYTVYYFKDSGMDFNPADYEIPDHVKMLSFQTGELAGRGDGEGAFQANWHEDTQEWEIINVYPDDSTQLPGGEIIPQVGDTYIPWNFTLPQEYIDAAEQAYAEAVDDFLATYSFDTKKYNGTTDRNYVEDNGTPLKVGWNVRLLSEEYFAGGHKDTRITKVVRKLNDLCQATVTCTDQIGTGWKKTMENQLGSLYYELARKAEQTIIDIIKTTDTKTPGDHNVYSALRSRLEFLSKTHPETMPFLMTFLDGIVIGEHGFAGGLAGFGAKIDKKGYGEMRGLRLWEWLEVPEIRCNRVEVFLGIKWRVPGAGIVLTCTPDTDAEGNTLSTGTCVLKLEDGELGAVALDDIALGIYHFQDAALNATKDTDDGKGNFTFSGFATTYFRITGVSGSDHGTFTYSLRPGHTVHPQPQMHFACYGNFTDTSRQASVYETRTYTRKLWKQNTWEIGPQNIAQQDGDLSNLNINGMSLEGYSAYLNSVYFTGQILQVKPDGTPVRTANDRGAWAAGHYDYYDRVSHDGCIWLCVNEGGTNAEPAESSADWLLQVKKGNDGKNGKDGKDGINGADGIAGKDGTSIVWQGEAARHPDNPKNGWAYRNTTDKKSYVYQDGSWYQMTVDGIDGQNGKDGKDGLSIVWKGDLTTAPANPQLNWAYRDTDNGRVYIYNGNAWELMVVDGSNGADGAKGADGLSVFITYHDSTAQPAVPTGNGTTGGWHTAATSTSIWMSQKVAASATEGSWGTPIKIKGETGAPGKDGRGVSEVKNYYLATGAASGVTTATGGWTEQVQNVTASKRYLWNYEEIIYTDGSSVKTTPSIVGNFAADGQDGTNGVGIAGVTEEYGLSTSQDTQPTSWTLLPPKMSATDKYLWNRETTKYTDNTTRTVTHLIAVYGDKGDSITHLGNWKTGLFVPYLGIVRMGYGTYMCINKNGTSNPPMWTIVDKDNNRLLQTQDGGKTYGYILTGEMNSTEYALVASDGADGLNGTNGIDGAPGKDGRTPYFHIKYSANANGNPMSETPSVYIGTYTDFTQADSDDPADYTWARFQGIQGLQGIPGTNGIDGKTYYLHIKYSNDGGATFTGNGGEDPGKFMGTLVDLNPTDSNTPTAYKWAQVRGEDGQPGKDGVSVTHHGNWKTGLFVPYMGIVRMGNASWICTNVSGTSNPPCWTVTDKAGNRILQTQDGGRTYGYILTGENNTAEYDVVAEDGKPGQDGQNGQDGKQGIQGLQGCILRRSEWKTGAEYRNDESLTSGTRYVDVALVRDANTATGWRAYKCRATHTSSLSNAPGNGTYWEEFGINTTSIFTDVIIAKNASIDLMWGQQVAVTDDGHNPVAGLTSRGIGSNTNVCIFGGSITAGTAPFMVMRDGSMTATKANITGTVNAVAGVIAGFSISGNSLTNVGFDNNAAVIFRNDTTKCFAGIGGNVFPATTGITCVGRFENCDTSDTWSWSKNVAVYLRAEGAKFNYAFVGTGNGVLDGMVEGFALQYVSSTGTTVHSTDISKGKYIVFYTASGTFNHLLPTRQNIQDTLGIDASRKFAVLLHYFTKYTAGGSTFLYGRTTDIGGANTDQYPYLYDHNGNNTRVQLSKGDSAQVLVVYDGFNFFAQLVNVRN